MFRQRLGVTRAAAGAMIALALTITPAFAGHGGGGGGGGGGRGGGGGGGGYHGGGGGGYHGGGYYGGGYHGGGYYGGYRGGYYGGYGYGYYGPGIGVYIGDYPSYGYTTSANYYNPDVPYVEPGADAPLSVNSGQPAHIRLQLPDPDAHVWFDGNETHQSGTERLFATPPLTPGRTYHYQIEVKWMENGKEMSKTRTITVNPGESATVIF